MICGSVLRVATPALGRVSGSSRDALSLLRAAPQQHGLQGTFSPLVPAKFTVLLLFALAEPRQRPTAQASLCGTLSFVFPLYRPVYSPRLMFISFTPQWISHSHAANNSAWVHPGFSQSPSGRTLCCAPFHFFTCHIFSLCYNLAGSWDVIMLRYLFVSFTSLAKVSEFPKIPLCQVDIYFNYYSAQTHNRINNFKFFYSLSLWML